MRPADLGGRGGYLGNMDTDCLFCLISAGEVPADVVYTNDEIMAFTDISPKAPTHILVIPRQHFANIRELAADPRAGAAVLAGIAAVAEQLNLPYFTTIFNTGAESGQSVMHVHAHILSGSGQIWAHNS